MGDFPCCRYHSFSFTVNEIHSHRPCCTIILLLTDHAYYYCNDHCCDYLSCHVSFLRPSIGCVFVVCEGRTKKDLPSQCSPKVLWLIFFKIEDTWGRHIPFFYIQNKLHWHIYRLLHGCTVSEKLLKIPLFGPSVIHQLWLLESQQHPQSGVLLTSFATWVTENSLAEINLESTGDDKGL